MFLSRRRHALTWHERWNAQTADLDDKDWQNKKKRRCYQEWQDNKPENSGSFRLFQEMMEEREERWEDEREKR